MINKITLAVRLLLGTVFLVFGLNGFFYFIPTGQMPEHVVQFFTTLMSTGYFMPLVKGTEVLCGILLLSGQFVPLALVVLTPIVVNILAFHLFMDRSGLPIALGVVAMLGFLVWSYRRHYDRLWERNARPSHPGNPMTHTHHGDMRRSA